MTYEWKRGTRDTGRHFFTDKITIDMRKRLGMKVFLHLSNVNHWLLSHDNVWCALPEDHPALGDMTAGLLEGIDEPLDAVMEGHDDGEADDGGDVPTLADEARVKLMNGVRRAPAVH